MRLFNKRLIAIVLLAFVAAACDDDDPSTPLTPTVPKTESFSGVLVQNRSEMQRVLVAVGGGG